MLSEGPCACQTVLLDLLSILDMLSRWVNRGRSDLASRLLRVQVRSRETMRGTKMVRLEKWTKSVDS